VSNEVTASTAGSAAARSPDAAERLGTEPVGRLLLRFAIPGITGLLVNALYHFVDRIFVGRIINESALGGLSLTMPLLSLMMAFAMLFGHGAANMISMRLGQNRRQDAERALNNGLFTLAGIGIVLAVIGLTFTDQILSLMGAQEGSLALDYAKRYFRATLFGAVFFQVGFGFSHCTRAQGFPTVTMIGLLLGAVLNVAFDALFMIVFKWGIEGAGWATVASQFVWCVWILSFSFSKKAVVRIRLKTFKPSLSCIREMMSFGSPQFVTAVAISGVQLIINMSIGWYGADSLGVEKGGDIALSALNIINTISMMIFMPVFGIIHGAQPILGFNYGAKKFDRVLKTYIRAVLASTAICLFGFIIAQSFPLALVKIFVQDGSPTLYEFTPRAMRTMLTLMPLIGLQAVSAHMFAATGRPKVAILLNMLRQCIVLIPCIVIFGRMWGLNGIILALPVADGISFIFTGIMVSFELRKLRSLSKQQLVSTST